MKKSRTRIKQVVVKRGALEVKTYYYPQVKVSYLFGILSQWLWLYELDSYPANKKIQTIFYESGADRFETENGAREMLNRYEKQNMLTETVIYK